MITIGIALHEPIDLHLKEIDGWTEQRIDRDDPVAAETLAEALITDEAGEPVSVAEWPVAAFDRLLLEIYRKLYGDRAECRVACRSCSESYEFDLNPRAIAISQDAAAQGIPTPDEDGWWYIRNGFELRAPRLSDVGLGDQETLFETITRGDVVDWEDAELFLERAAPVLDLDIAASCPDCGASQDIRFNLSEYLVTALANERPFLIRETHLLAAHYGWPHREILDLTRTDRRAYAALIESERSASQRMRQVP